MATIIVGGQASKVGKTDAIVGILHALQPHDWTAFKITPHLHGLTTVPFSITEEHDATAAKDTSRFLAAGAIRSFWVRAVEGHLEEAMPQLQSHLASAKNTIIESNTILDFLKPDLSVIVLDPAKEDFKDSANEFLLHANAILWTIRPEQTLRSAAWLTYAAMGSANKLQFVLDPQSDTCVELLQWISAHVGA